MSLKLKEDGQMTPFPHQGCVISPQNLSAKTLSERCQSMTRNLELIYGYDVTINHFAKTALDKKMTNYHF